MDYSLNISTDKTFYDSGNAVKVTASFTNWPTGDAGKVRLVIWEYHTNNHITDTYYTKPASGNTVQWIIDFPTFGQHGKKYDAQIEYYAMHADAVFDH